jgi:release factor glutamine methyltransferase
MDVRTALLQGTKLLEEGAVPAPRLTSEVLLAHALNRERTWLFAHPEQILTDLQQLHYGRYLHERLRGKPTQYITKRQEFYGREFRVTSDVLIPRPETEHVIETALKLDARRIADVGCGSGAIAITLQLETGAEVWGTDISLPALAVAAANARRLEARINLVACDILATFADGCMDLVVSNPPYVPFQESAHMQREVRDYEPHVALFAGDTGFEIYGRIVREAQRVLRPDGWLVMELGFQSRDGVVGMLAGWRNLEVTPDLAGIPRVIAAQSGKRQ